MKRIMILLGLVILVNHSFGQQQPLYTQYMLNNYAINPAITGIEEFWTVKLTHRAQWVGFDGAPVTSIITGHGVVSDKIAIGGMLFNDMLGPIRKTGLNATYAYHIPLEQGQVSLGIGAGIFQYTINGTEITTAEPNDQAIPSTNESVIIPDASFGIYYKTDQYYLGGSVPHLLGTKFKITTFDRTQAAQLARHYFIYGGIYYEINRDVYLEPSALIKYVRAAPFQLDLNLKAHFNDMFWVGASYRSFAAITAFAGLTLNDSFHIGYAYDITTTALRNYSKGSHEIMLGYDFTSGY
ncbi:MAG: type IX secretion system membrane protein PorP/SprF [Bacteroidetes bacterium]|nr:type IX secretion system membrane protein PorP/SprF [Bacteroidota bacterium]